MKVRRDKLPLILVVVVMSTASIPDAWRGAACCQIAELPPYKAAPLQALGGFCALRVCKPY
jgi:hypothetical protein